MSLHLDEKDLESKLLPRLNHRAFHVTNRHAAENILADGAIYPNDDERYDFTSPQSEVSVMRRHGCVSVFDLRQAMSHHELHRARYKLDYLNPSFAKNRPVYFLLTGDCLDKLQPWSAFGADDDPSQMVIPSIESGHDGSILLEQVQTILYVSVIVVPPPPDSWSYITWLAAPEDTDESTQE